MRPLTLGLLISLAAAYGVLAQDPAATRAQPIRGQVVDARNSVPLRRALVVVSSGDRQIELSFTDDEGWFVIANAPVSPLTVRGSKAGYAAALVTVPAGRAGTEIRFALAKSAGVMGRVLDENRAPVSGAFVTGRLLLPGTDRTPAASGRVFARTDRLGEYRLGSLPAGRYEITAVRIPPERSGQGATVEEQVFGSPDELDVASGAATLALAGGDEARDVDFTIPGIAQTCLTGSRVRPPEGVVTSAITGRVIAASGEPLVCATVRVLTPGVNLSEVFTDRQGRYAIDGLPAGSFLVEARQSGYITLQYGQRTPSDAEMPIALRDGEQRTRADFVLPRESIVTGTVVDEHGEPVEGIQVRALQLGPVDGRTTALSILLTRSTDDRGQYRVIGLRPGTYVVAAMPPRGAVSNASADARGYAAIYHPGTPDVSTAQQIAIDAGRDAHGIDISFTPTLTATVSGSVVGADGRPFAGTVSVFASARSGAVSVDSWSAPTDANGAFVIRNVPRGDYVVKAVGPAGGRPQFGMQYITVLDADPPPVRIVASGGATLEGLVVIEGKPDIDIAGLAVSVAPADFDYIPPGPGQLPKFAREDDGMFRAWGVNGPSRIVIAATPSCEGCYLKFAYVNGTDAADRPFDFGLKGGVYRGVDIVVSDAGASIEGRAVDERGARVHVYAVVVIPVYPELRYSRSRHLRAVRSAPDGSFRVTGLPPGDYFVAAVNRADSIIIGQESNDPEMLEQLAAGAPRVTVAERERRTLDLRLIRR